jgi:ribosomal protein L12E/L44/L45/RPP1/RPP2
MSKPFNIHDWQAKQKQQRLDEQYYVTANRGPKRGKSLVRSAESDYEEPRVFSSYGEAEAYIKRVKSSGATPGQISSYWVSDENMNRIEDPVVAKGDGLEITQDEMERLQRNGRVRLKNGSLLVFPSKLKEDDIDEASMTGTGASFQAGAGEAYATPYAFKKKRKKD